MHSTCCSYLWIASSSTVLEMKVLESCPWDSSSLPGQVCTTCLLSSFARQVPRSESCYFCPNWERQQDRGGALPVLLQKVTCFYSSPGYRCGSPALPTPFKKGERWLMLKTCVSTTKKTKRKKAKPRKEGEPLLIFHCVSIKIDASQTPGCWYTGCAGGTERGYIRLTQSHNSHVSSWS